MKKKILFVCYGLGIGGIEKCLVNLLNVMPDEYEIDLLLMNPQYAFRDQIRRKVRYLNTFDYVMNIEDTLPEIRRRGGLLRNPGMLLSYCVFRLRLKLWKQAWKGFKPLPDQYDVAIAYSHHDFSPNYVIDKVQAKKKVLWYHNGAYEHEGARYEQDKQYYQQFDHIVAVANDCAKVLSDKFDFRDGQLLLLRNVCDPVSVKEMADRIKPASFEKNGCHIVTVGRMTPEKGADLALKACKTLCDQGKNIFWHWVGDGNQAETVKREIAALGLQDRFLLEGNQENPYPYIRWADIYVQPSYYEGYSTTITEAKILGRPIVTTDVGGMRDQLISGKNGLIVPIDSGELAAAVKTLVEQDELRSAFSAALQNETFDPDDHVQEYIKTVFS